MGSAKKKGMNLFAGLQETKKDEPVYTPHTPDPDTLVTIDVGVPYGEDTKKANVEKQKDTSPKKKGPKVKYVDGYQTMTMQMTPTLYDRVTLIAAYKRMSKTAYITSLVEEDIKKHTDLYGPIFAAMDRK